MEWAKVEQKLKSLNYGSYVFHGHNEQCCILRSKLDHFLLMNRPSVNNPTFCVCEFFALCIFVSLTEFAKISHRGLRKRFLLSDSLAHFMMRVKSYFFLKWSRLLQECCLSHRVSILISKLPSSWWFLVTEWHSLSLLSIIQFDKRVEMRSIPARSGYYRLRHWVRHTWRG